MIVREKQGRIRILLALVGCIVGVLLLAGCGSDTGTLEGYMKEHSDEAQKIEQQMKSMETDDTAIDVAYEDNQLIINCNLKATHNEDMVGALKESYEETMDDAIAEFMTGQTAALEDSTGISGISIVFRVNNGDGTEIWSGEYSSDGSAGSTAEASSEDAASAESESEE